MMKLKYTLSFDGDYSHVNIPELEGESILTEPDEVYYDDEYLDIEHFCFMANFCPYFY